MIPKLYKVISGKYVDDTLTYLLTHQGGEASVTPFTQDIVLTNGTIPLETGFYNTGNYGLFVGSQTPQNLIFGTGEIIYVDKDTLTIIGSLVSIAYDTIDSLWTIQDNQKIENEITNNRDKIPTSQAVYNGLATKQNTLTAGSGISIVGNVISATGGGGGGVTVTPLTQNIILEANNSTTGLTTGFYYTNGYGVYYHTATSGNLIYGNEVFYYDDSILTFVGNYNVTEYSVGDTDWIVTNNASVESTLTNSTIHVPNSYAVSQALGEKQDTLTAGTGIEINNNVISTKGDYMSIGLAPDGSVEQTISGSAMALVNSSLIDSNGSSLTFDSTNHCIVIGSGVHHIEVSCGLYVKTYGSASLKGCAVQKNNDTPYLTRIVYYTTQNYTSFASKPNIVSVQENDTISLKAISASGNMVITGNDYQTSLLVKVID